MSKIFSFKMLNGNVAQIKTSKCKHFYVSVKRKDGICTPFVRLSWSVIRYMVKDADIVRGILINERKKL